MEKPLLFKNTREGSDYTLKDYTRLYSQTLNKICLMSYGCNFEAAQQQNLASCVSAQTPAFAPGIQF